MSALLQPEAPQRSRPEESFTSTLARLGGAQKGAVGAPAYSRFVNRKAGRVLAAAAYQLGMTPNAVTGVSACLTFSGIALLALVAPSWPMAVAVGLLLALGYAFDSADGQLARLRGGGSPAGEWLDHMVDALKIASLHLALLIGLYRFEPVERGPWLLVPLAFSVISVVFFFGTLLNESLRAQHGAPTRASRRGPRPGVLRSLLVLPTDYGVLCLVFMLWGAPVVFLAAYGALMVLTGAFLALACVTWFQEMGRLVR